MKKTSAIVLLLIGILLFMGSCAPLGYILYHEVITDASESVSLSGQSDEFSFQSTPGSLARFKVEADIETPSVQEDPDSFDDEYLGRFKFPISYTISDASGNVLVTDDISLAWKDGGNISKNNENVTSTGGTLTASTNLDKFDVPADGHFNIVIEISPDTTYEAVYESPQLHLYEEMIDNTWFIVCGIIMGLTGFILAITGFIFVITVSAQTSIQQQTPDDSTSSEVKDEDINQQAMFIQLSAFAGYIIPFGTVIAPVVLWLIWRDKDPYLNEMGREAVNFQLSMVLYYIISFVLCFVIIGFLLIFAAMVFHLAFIIIAAVQTSHGHHYRYPMTIRFIKG